MWRAAPTSRIRVSLQGPGRATHEGGIQSGTDVVQSGGQIRNPVHCSLFSFE
jgi:hypothetical protein